MSNNEYPEEIYICCENHGPLVDEIDYGGRQVKVMTEKAYDLGKKHALADTGDWHNLTDAIKAGEPIDFEELDRRKARLVNGETVVETVIRRDCVFTVDDPFGWLADGLWAAFKDGWRGERGWTLWVDGEIPMKKQTADELEPGTEFYGVLKTSEPEGVAPDAMLRTQAHVLHLDDYTISQISPRHIEVVTVVGMYGQKESE